MWKKLPKYVFMYIIIRYRYILTCTYIHTYSTYKHFRSSYIHTIQYNTYGTFMVVMSSLWRSLSRMYVSLEWKKASLSMLVLLWLDRSLCEEDMLPTLWSSFITIQHIHTYIHTVHTHNTNIILCAYSTCTPSYYKFC